MKRFFLAAVVLWSISQATCAGPIRDFLRGHAAAQETGDRLDQDDAGRPSSLPNGVKLLRDVAYGPAQRQRMDVYLPARKTKGAPVVFMVHGGAWRLGDKASSTVVENKISRWVARGVIFVSVNYRLLPEADPWQQADDVAHALAAAQERAESWGGDPAKFILMGHSAGAHLVALLASSPARALGFGARPWLGAVLLDSAALNVVEIMEARHARFYDRAFGSQSARWPSASPFHVLTSSAVPMLAVCSTRRDDACPQARRFREKASTLRIRTEVLEQPLSHGDINKTLGRPGAYTGAVEAFMGSLDPVVQRALSTSTGGASR